VVEAFALEATSTMQLEKSWQRAWQMLGLQAPEDLRERLVGAYEEPHRRYHSLQHLGECIAHFESALELGIHPGEVELALWFHDAIYELQAKDNEQRSAEWAVDELKRCGAQPDQTRRVYALIMATCHTATPADADQQLLVDIDLAILGAGPARFAEYDAQVRAEYSWVPEAVYRVKRREVLQGFLDRPVIYSTPHFRARLEQPARANLQAAIG
jgi:predicted metal-dependent HD superfamily phosphohydrolase